MNRKLVGFFSLLLVLSAAIALAACGGGGSSTSGETSEASSGGEETSASEESSASEGGSAKTVYLNEYTRTIPYFQEITKGMDNEAGKVGWTVEKSYGNSDPEQQVNQVQNAIVTQPDAMVIIPVDEEAISPVMRQATQAGIPVAAMGDNVEDESARDFFLGVDYEALGEEKAEWLVEQLHGKGTIGFIHGIRGLNFTELQNIGASKVFDENPGIEVIEGPYTGALTSDLGLNATEDLLAREPDMDAIYYDNDDLALGGIQAIKQAGLNPKKILIAGTDGGPPALEAVKAGELDYTLSLCGYAQGVQVIELLHAQLEEGIEPESTILTEPLEFTPENYAQNIKKVEDGEC